MPRYLDTRGNSKLAIAICARCSVKYPWSDLSPDPNYPGLMVCPDGCKDQFDPWRLAPRETEDITMAWARPDTDLYPIAPADVAINPIQAVLSEDGIVPIASGGSGSPAIAVAGPATPIMQAQPWAPNTSYPLGAQVTIGTEYGPTVAASNMKVFLCIVPGPSGPTAPPWNTNNGALTNDFQAIWMCNGLFLP